MMNGLAVVGAWVLFVAALFARPRAPRHGSPRRGRGRQARRRWPVTRRRACAAAEPTRLATPAERRKAGIGGGR